MTSIGRGIALALVAAMSTACWGSGMVEDRDSGADSDTDSDTDSDADTDADGDIDTDTDTDTDTDSDTDTDTDADTDSDAECTCFSAALPCCDGCYFYGTDHVCDPQYEVRYSCADAPSCADEILVASKARSCSGTTVLCDGDVDSELGAPTISETCGNNEVCLEVEDEGTAECQLDPVTCPVGFGDRICWPGGTLPDCGTLMTECLEPYPELDEVYEVAELGVGAVVKLEITASDHGGFVAPGSFTDTLMTVTHGTTVASVFNYYHGIQVSSYVAGFPPVWYLPHFSGQEMGGVWTVHFEDHAYNNLMTEQPTEMTEICVTFLDPATTAPVSEGEWISEAIGEVETSPYAAAMFEMQIEEIVDVSGQTPWLELDVTPLDAHVSIDLIGADGTIITVKTEFEDEVPTAVLIEDLMSDWLTGRWSLVFTYLDYTETVTLNGWSIHLDGI